MKNKNKGEFYFLCALVVIASVFIFFKISRAETNLKFSKIQYGGGEGRPDEDFITIINRFSEPINLKGYRLVKRSAKATHDTTIKSWTADTLVSPDSFYTWANSKNGFAESIKADVSTTQTITEGNGIALRLGKEDEGTIIDSVNWKEGGVEEKIPESDKSAGINIKTDKEIYPNIYANFKVEYSGATSATKYTWNFGDGHKSYKQKTRHKYNNEGKYQASVTIRGDKSAIKNFELEVKDFNAPKVKITAIVPNPKGKDSGEYILIQNKSKKKINLLNWSIATGWKNLYNHPIKKDFVIKKGETKKLTKKISLFTLNNTKTKLELRTPSGEAVQKIKYNRKKDKIEEDEIFEISGKKWEWNKPPTDTKKEPENKKINNAAENPISSSEKLKAETENNSEENKKNMIITPQSEIDAAIGKFTKNSRWEGKKSAQLQLIAYGTNISMPTNLPNNQGMVLGIYAEKKFEKEKHWTKKLSGDWWKKINFGLNWCLNKI
ncbi:MAG TPA: lamin tail domain-containing protein [Candidatus Moranbacteria bacterium]|nr:lamin tail domain-containing protein [Candidatus Moranbacteria bacterium]